MTYRRYAIYVTPQGPLATRGAAWLGWDMQLGCTVAHPRIDDIDVARLTARPRKYGFHGTLKPPMFLSAGRTAEELKCAAGALAMTLAPVHLDGLMVKRIGGFLALVPLGDQSALKAMAATVVQSLESFRAPPTDAELTRRRQSRLTPSQERNLNQWGYPYVMEEFRFHITLTGSLKDADTITPAVAAHFAPAITGPFEINDLTFAGEDADGMFHQTARLPLGG